MTAPSATRHEAARPPRPRRRFDQLRARAQAPTRLRAQDAACAPACCRPCPCGHDDPTPASCGWRGQFGPHGCPGAVELLGDDHRQASRSMPLTRISASSRSRITTDIVGRRSRARRHLGARERRGPRRGPGSHRSEKFAVGVAPRGQGRWRSRRRRRARRRRKRRRGSATMFISASSSACELGGAMDRRADARIGAAAADIGHRGIDIVIRRLRICLSRRRSGEDLAGLAIAALRHLLLDPGALHRMRARDAPRSW